MHESWITIAVDEEQALKALILGRSLRQVGSTFKKIVVLGGGVPSAWKARLEREFDGVFAIKGEEFQTCYVRALGLPLVRKAVFLDPNVVVFGNIDPLFETEKDGEYRVGGVPDGRLVYSIFSPSAELMDGDLMFQTHSSKGSVLSLENQHLDPDLPLALLDNQIYQKLMKNEQNFPNFGESETLILHYWTDLYTQVKTSTEASDYPGKEPIAIIGYSCRFPESNTPEEFWELLSSGSEAISSPPVGRWDPSVYPNSPKECWTSAKAGFLSCNVSEFDSKFFGMSPRESEFTDPQQRLLLEVTWEALEHSGIDPTSLKNTRTGIFTGVWMLNYRDMLRAWVPREDFIRAYIGAGLGSSAAKLAHFFGTTGSNIATESACSSSIVALGMAIRSLRAGESTLALACGVHLHLEPFCASDGPVFSSDGRCKTFAFGANGYGRGEGVATLVLKRYSDAIKSNDIIHGVIRGYGEAQEGPSESIGTPSIAIQSLAMSLALKDGGVAPAEVSFIETHGTGTPVGDPSEIEAVAKVYADPVGRSTPLILTSLKPNIGHTESCAGIASVIKALLALKHEMIPPHVGCSQGDVHPKIEALLPSIPALIPIEGTPVPWRREAGKRRIAGVSCFGITGTDAHVLIEEAPIFPTLPAPEWPCHVVTVSAKSDDALKTLAGRYIAYLNSNLSSPLANIAFSVNTGRAHLATRVAVVGRNVAEVAKKLSTISTVEAAQRPPPKICFLFGGQGSHYHGMGKKLYENFPKFREVFDQCHNFVERLGFPFKHLIWGDQPHPLLDGPVESQVSTFIIQYATLKLLESWNIRPDVVSGHSLGEYVAGVAAGISSIEIALQVVIGRQLIDKASATSARDGSMKGAMISVNASADETSVLIKALEKNNPGFWLDISCVNSPTQTVLGGTVENVSKFAEMSKWKTIQLRSNLAYHTRLMKPMADAMKERMSLMPMGEPMIPYVSSITGALLCPGEMRTQYWVDHITHSVKYPSACATIRDLGVTHCIDISPQPVLAALFATNIDTVKAIPSMRRSADDVETILNAVATLYEAGVTPNFQEIYRGCGASLSRRDDLPHYPFQRREYWYKPHPQKRQNRRQDEGNGEELHPFLGEMVSNPTDKVIFCKKGLLPQGSQAYLQDHKIGEHIVFPGAGYVEMCVAAGADEGGVPTTPITVSNLRILSPLELDGKSGVDVSIVKESDEKVEIFRKNADNWLILASATLSKSHTQQATTTMISFPPSKPEWEESGSPSKFYEKVTQTGIGFGPLFQSIKKTWSKDKELICQVEAPFSDKHFTHPILIDAMIQATALGEFVVKGEEESKKLRVPVGIKTFTWFGKVSPDSEIFVYVTPEKTVLYEGGKVLAEMTGVELMETDVATISKALATHQGSKLPGMYEQIWVPDEDSDPQPLPHWKCEEILPPHPHGHSTASYDALRQSVDSTCAQGIIKALSKVGWVDMVGSTLDVCNFPGVLPKNFLMFRRLIEILGDEQYQFFQKEGEGDPYKFKQMKPLPPSQEPHPHALQSGEQLLASACLEKLPSVLKGEESVLPILFPQDPGAFSAEALYSKSPYAQELNGLLAQSVDALVAKCFDRRKLKILEVGAGTGSATSVVVPSLEKRGAKFAYTYTDLSSAFFANAETKFQGLQYQVLNIEEDPLAQGFSPFSYDLIIASNVLHATVDLTQTLKNIRVLLSKGGAALVLESFKPTAFIDCTFGLLEGYWRFQDLNLRPYHTLVGKEQWVELLRSGGFVQASGVSVMDGCGGLVVGVASETSEWTFTCPKRESWLVFGPPTPFRNALVEAMKALDRSVVTVGFDKNDTSSTHTTSPSRELNIKKLIQEGSGYEGLLYLWGMDPSAEMETTVRGFLSIAKAIATTQPFRRIVVATRLTTPTSACLWGMSRSLRNECVQLPLHSVELPPQEGEESLSSVRLLLQELWRHSNDMEVAYRDGGDRMLPRCAPLLKLPKGGLAFHPDKAYLITGGLGGIGLATAAWMATKGARNFILLGRSQPTPQALEKIRSLQKEHSANVDIHQCDVGDFEALKKVIKEIQRPLGGVFHSAGTLSDALMANQTWEKYQSVFQSKVKGSWNLHLATKDLPHPLDHFVLYSSLASIIGSPGQSNHSAGNAYMDALAHHRRSLGLPGLSINWGQWGEVGVAANLELPGVSPFPPEEAFAALESLILRGEPQCIVVNADFQQFSRIFPWLKPYLKGVVGVSTSSGDGPKNKSKGGFLSTENFWKDYNSATTEEGKVGVVASALSTAIAFILRLDEDDESPELEKPFTEMGMDSLMLIELKNATQGFLGARVTLDVNQLMDCLTIKALAVRIVELIKKT